MKDKQKRSACESGANQRVCKLKSGKRKSIQKDGDNAETEREREKER